MKTLQLKLGRLEYCSAAILLFFALNLLTAATVPSPSDNGISIGEFRGPQIVMMGDPELGFPYDKYEPVMFRHQFHADLVKDCSICHHHFDQHEELARETGTSCEPCHSGQGDRTRYRTIPCKTCHESDFSDNNFKRIGLKGAVHRLCIDCHAVQAAGPTECMECHIKNVPNHSQFIQEYKGATTCEECHPGKTAEVMDSTHYKLMALLPLNYVFLDDEGKTKAPFDTSGMVAHASPTWATVPQINWLYELYDDPATPNIDVVGGCGVCHIGYGREPYTALWSGTPSFGEEHNVDCLICHSETYERKFYPMMSNGEPVISQGRLLIRAVPVNDGVPDFDVYTKDARKITHTKTEYCMRCHERPGGKVQMFTTTSYNYKRGVGFKPDMDVHASLGITCSQCHYTSRHQFQRKLSSDLLTYGDARLEEGCLDCHRFAHTRDGMTNMVARVSCTACHANSTGGVLEIDYSKPTLGDADARHSYEHPNIHIAWAESEWKPFFKWFARKVKFPYTPIGTRNDGMLYPYKRLQVTIPVDANGNLIPIKHDSLLIDNDMEAAIKKGQEAYLKFMAGSGKSTEPRGMPPLPGEHTGFKTIDYYYTFSHGISKNEARPCEDCHSESRGLDWKALNIGNPHPLK